MSENFLFSRTLFSWALLESRTDYDANSSLLFYARLAPKYTNNASTKVKWFFYRTLSGWPNTHLETWIHFSASMFSLPFTRWGVPEMHNPLSVFTGTSIALEMGWERRFVLSFLCIEWIIHDYCLILIANSDSHILTVTINLDQFGCSWNFSIWVCYHHLICL